MKKKSLKALRGKMIIKMDVRQKEKLLFCGRDILQIQKGFDFNLRQDNPSMAIVIDGEGLNAGDFILVHHLSNQPSYAIEDNTFLTTEEIADGYKIFSVPIDNGFCYSKDGENWTPCKNFLITSRLFKPYKGKMQGIPHEKIERRLFVVRGYDYEGGEQVDISGNVMITTDFSDYEIIWHDTKHKETRLVRTRNREVLAIDHKMTKDLKEGKILMGLSEESCKVFNESGSIMQSSFRKI